MHTPKHSEKSLIAALNNLERRWPDDYALFDYSGRLILIRLNGDGSFPDPSQPGATNDATIETFPGIISGGGDPD